ncbi:beta strand repeat-containing protein [Falsiruegeria mediterranea]
MSGNSTFQLSHLNGANGFRIYGVGALDSSGYSVASAGDVNGDGFDDVIVGAPSTTVNGATRAGETYVVFGANSGFGPSLSLDDLDGRDGIRVQGAIAGSWSGFSVSSAGDVNGDGFDDIIIGAHEASPNDIYGAGESYVVFGAATGFPAALSSADLDGSNGFRVVGIDYDDYSGRSVASAGDLNGDGFDDILIGAESADPNGTRNAGESYVVFGAATGFASSLPLAGLNGSNGFVIAGIDASDNSGYSVASAGDVNGDGFDDIIIGAYYADPHGVQNAGESYVVFGAATGFSPSLSLAALNGSNGFRINGVASADGRSGTSVASAGDVNGDGFDDIIIGAPGVGAAGESPIGESYVVFGSDTGFSASLSLSGLNGSNGFRIEGIQYGDRNGISVSSAGDVNGDGFDDILIGASGADPNRQSSAGESYVVLGTNTGFSASFSLSDLNGSNGFLIQGIDVGDFSGASVSSAGDVNGDGFDDIIIGAYRADPNGQNQAGESYVVFGSANGFGAASPVQGTDADDWLTLPADWRLGLRQIDGGDGTDMMSFAGLDGGIYANTTTGQANSGFASAPFDLIMTSIENVTGTSHADIFNGSDRAEVFRGLGGQDTFYGSHAGADTYQGGGGNDTLTYIQSGEGVSASLFRGRGWSGDAEGDLISEIENLTGTNHDDFLWGDHGDNSLTGGHGDDEIVGAGGDDYILAGHGTDTIIYSGNRSDYTILQNGIRTEVIDTLGRDGHDVIGHAEVLQFADGDFIL